MPLKIADKREIVAQVNAVANSALSAAIADYRGLSVAELTDLRKQARETNVFLKVVRNTLAKRAVEGTEFECLQDSFVGPTILAFANDEPGAAARLFKDFAKENDAFEVTALSVGGKLLGPEQIDTLAKLPTRDEALSILMSVMIAPITKLARTLNEVPGKLTRTVAAIRDQKQNESN